MKTPKFGKVVETQQLDADGSTLSIETNYQNGSPRFPRWRHVEYRVRVTDAKQEMTEYLRFCDEKTGKSSSVWCTETNDLGNREGWYYCVKKFTEVISD